MDGQLSESASYEASCAKSHTKFPLSSFFVLATEPPTVLFGRSFADEIGRSVEEVRYDRNLHSNTVRADGELIDARRSPLALVWREQA
ncbi:MAG: hypothetical protein EOR72_18890 [Mesorhizobium sp.]|nr:MAG: hypothetical protein EOR72_18890 [Mesorhizobium sp.]